MEDNRCLFCSSVLTTAYLSEYYCSPYCRFAFKERDRLQNMIEDAEEIAVLRRKIRMLEQELAKLKGP